MRKGAHLEQQIDKLLKYLDAQGIHGHKNRANRAPDGTYIEGEPFDYEVFSPSKVWCFDAKECEASAWPLCKAKLSQVNNLEKVRRVGCEAFFLVWFEHEKKLIKFDVSMIQKSLGVKGSVTPNEGSEFDWRALLK
jgi:penicillin-binding protein-related factor A (putative recombinase)